MSEVKPLSVSKQQSSCIPLEQQGSCLPLEQQGSCLPLGTTGVPYLPLEQQGSSLPLEQQGSSLPLEQQGSSLPLEQTAITITNLPNDLITYISSFLPVESVGSLFQVSKFLSKFAKSENFWAYYVKSNFNGTKLPATGSCVYIKPNHEVLFNGRLIGVVEASDRNSDYYDSNRPWLWYAKSRKRLGKKSQTYSGLGCKGRACG